jgi:hypothetical protein
VKGAREAGMETTYWWTALNTEALNTINKFLPRDATLGFYPMSPDMWQLYGELGFLRKDITVTDGEDAQYVFILSRPYSDLAGSYIFAGAKPAHPRVIASHKIDDVALWVLYKRG